MKDETAGAGAVISDARLNVHLVSPNGQDLPSKLPPRTGQQAYICLSTYVNGVYRYLPGFRADPHVGADSQAGLIASEAKVLVSGSGLCQVLAGYLAICERCACELWLCL